MRGTRQPTLWEFTRQSTKEAVKLYFQPVRQMISLAGDEEDARQKQEEIESRLQKLEQKTSPRFDSLEDLESRVSRLGLETDTEQKIKSQLKEIEALLADAQSLAQTAGTQNTFNELLAALQYKLRQMETDLGIETHLYPPPVRRTKGASGD